MSNSIRDWNPDDGDAYQGDVCLFRVPDVLAIATGDEISPSDGRLVLAEGEVTGHHHAIYFSPTHFRANEGEGGGTAEALAAITKASKPKATTTARLYRDPSAVRALVSAGELTTADLAIGFLIVEGGSQALTHDEHDAIRIPAGRYYVGAQREWDASQARRVQD